ncbi:MULTISPECIES: DUF4168 domain-containing protein [Leptolyngbya]|jgi:hypothetical protein|uniref:DUF4168 domain-containing protein n=2 Tax=Leptolyngbya boryana TaxID=1184 RepID=A0A1Z4JGP6_LEPBY|nr:MULTISPECIES: DUF4168 domain-containing protein [Leptolyngbya]BAY55942.1 hypothetical protein NIES2135_27690 [Leptolyngbya boryana NIES-2135]MBD1855011.1 DUF4168 domain-containing protein [Leptolyngbya sp. FACHB-1624]MBD2368759.1 DUF4168 domain-containing protein [Leptolyngbya sp. FACHB-161]MBD2375373.1 DUF4168 domain-containing protein [Leptolyngbya sp. FACHB-238]MBD2399791.1 DUF4168 domain-containing protein [Leptolyngbya sp. FACHB-239]
MIQRLLLSGCVLVIGGLCQMPVQAQTPTSKPAPTSQPANQTVTPAETRQFANAVKQVLAISREAEKQATQAIQSEGLTEQRFDEIFRSQNNPQQKPSKPVETGERQKYDRVIAKLTQISKDNDSKVETAVKKEGLEIPRFNQIFQIVRSNPQLRQQVQDMIRQ